MQEYALHNEIKVDRIIPGTTHPYLGAIPTKGCIPLAVSRNGTITTSGVKGLGTNTLWLTGGTSDRLIKGEWIHSNGVIRRIRNVFSDNYLELEYAFPVDLSAVAIQLAPRHRYTAIIVKSTNTTTAATAVQEQQMAAGELTITGGAPISYDMTAGNLEFTLSV